MKLFVNGQSINGNENDQEKVQKAIQIETFYRQRVSTHQMDNGVHRLRL